MKARALLAALTACAAGAGCGSFFSDACRNLTEAPIRACDDVRLKRDTRREARAAWDHYCRAHPGPPTSGDFAEGFKAGFADYLYEGGDGLPPAVPPFPYTLRRYETPQGHAAIETWYAGFAAGSAAAQESGLRDSIVIPLAEPPLSAVSGSSGRPAAPPPAAAPAPGSVPPGQQPEALPPPRVVHPAPPEGPPQLPDSGR
jgi:hypothetical protein